MSGPTSVTLAVQALTAKLERLALLEEQIRKLERGDASAASLAILAPLPASTTGSKPAPQVMFDTDPEDASAPTKPATMGGKALHRPIFTEEDARLKLKDFAFTFPDITPTLAYQLLAACANRARDRRSYESTKITRADLDKLKMAMHSLNPEVSEPAKLRRTGVQEQLRQLTDSQAAAQRAWQESVRALRLTHRGKAVETDTDFDALATAVEAWHDVRLTAFQQRSEQCRGGVAAAVAAIRSAAVALAAKDVPSTGYSKTALARNRLVIARRVVLTEAQKSAMTAFEPQPSVLDAAAAGADAEAAAATAATTGAPASAGDRASGGTDSDSAGNPTSVSAYLGSAVAAPPTVSQRRLGTYEIAKKTELQAVRDFAVGASVHVFGRPGTVFFAGRLALGPEAWVGVKLATPHGLPDPQVLAHCASLPVRASADVKRVLKCPPEQALFAPASLVLPHNERALPKLRHHERAHAAANKIQRAYRQHVQHRRRQIAAVAETHAHGPYAAVDAIAVAAAALMTKRASAVDAAGDGAGAEDGAQQVQQQAGQQQPPSLLLHQQPGQVGQFGKLAASDFGFSGALGPASAGAPGSAAGADKAGLTGLPWGSAEPTVSALARYLTATPATSTPVAKARALYRWVTEAVSQTWAAAPETEADPATVLADREGTALGISALYMALAEAAGLDCMVIQGVGKGCGALVSSRYTPTLSPAAVAAAAAAAAGTGAPVPAPQGGITPMQPHHQLVPLPHSSNVAAAALLPSVAAAGSSGVLDGSTAGLDALDGSADGVTHCWNAVRVEADRYALVDCTWGAGVWRGFGFQKTFSPAYFDADPSLFALDHFPLAVLGGRRLFADLGLFAAEPWRVQFMRAPMAPPQGAAAHSSRAGVELAMLTGDGAEAFGRAHSEQAPSLFRFEFENSFLPSRAFAELGARIVHPAPVSTVIAPPRAAAGALPLQAATPSTFAVERPFAAFALVLPRSVTLELTVSRVLPTAPVQTLSVKKRSAAPTAHKAATISSNWYVSSEPLPGQPDRKLVTALVVFPQRDLYAVALRARQTLLAAAASAGTAAGGDGRASDGGPLTEEVSRALTTFYVDVAAGVYDVRARTDVLPVFFRRIATPHLAAPLGLRPPAVLAAAAAAAAASASASAALSPHSRSPWGSGKIDNFAPPADDEFFNFAAFTGDSFAPAPVSRISKVPGGTVRVGCSSISVVSSPLVPALATVSAAAAGDSDASDEQGFALLAPLMGFIEAGRPLTVVLKTPPAVERVVVSAGADWAECARSLVAGTAGGIALLSDTVVGAPASADPPAASSASGAAAPTSPGFSRTALGVAAASRTTVFEGSIVVRSVQPVVVSAQLKGSHVFHPIYYLPTTPDVSVVTLTAESAQRPGSSAAAPASTAAAAVINTAATAAPGYSDPITSFSGAASGSEAVAASGAEEVKSSGGAPVVQPLRPLPASALDPSGRAYTLGLRVLSAATTSDAAVVTLTARPNVHLHARLISARAAPVPGIPSSALGRVASAALTSAVANAIPVRASRLDRDLATEALAGAGALAESDFLDGATARAEDWAWQIVAELPSPGPYTVQILASTTPGGVARFVANCYVQSPVVNQAVRA